MLKIIGMDKKRVVDCDALFFYQLILPVCNPKKSSVVDNPRLPYYTEVERFTNMSKAESGFGSSYYHSWKLATATELVHFDGVMIRDGVIGGSNGTIYRRFQQGSCCYSKK